MNKNQQGAVLVTSLVMLLLMTMLGVTAMSTTTLDEKMAGNEQDRELAFQAAEAALRDGEQFIENPPAAFLPLSSAVNDSCTNGLCSKREDDSSFDIDDTYSDTSWIDERWIENSHSNNLAVWSTNNRHRDYNTVINGVSTIPQYIIEFLTTTDCPGAVANSNDCEIYRVTALATGGTSNSRMMLQSTYRTKP